ncbi:MAG TPA: HdeD family acid-resistance protein [Rhizomicrobium sp.]|nr:HdeD family acid-resistance protein [Rhizomicrobium sp.]
MTDMTQNGIGDLRSAMHSHWKLFLIEGVVLLILGTAAIVVPPLASVVVSIFLGWLFIVGGIVGLVATIAGRGAPGFWWSLVSAIIAIVAGALLIGWPVGGALSLTLVLTAFLIADGILTIFFAIEHRRQLSQRWGWLLFNGIIDLLLAAVIVWAFPGSALWILGLIVGIDLIFGGWSLIAMAFAARSVKPA